MADAKISQLTAASTPLADTVILPIVQSGATVKATVANVQATPVSTGTANGVQYLNGSKVSSTSSNLTFNGNLLALSGTVASGPIATVKNTNAEAEGMVIDTSSGTNTIRTSLAFDRGVVGRAIHITAGGSNYQSLFFGTGSPEGVYSAQPGSLYLRRDGGAGTCFYVKESNTGNTGWVAK